MSKAKRVPLSSATLLQARNNFLTNGVEPLHPAEEVSSAVAPLRESPAVLPTAEAAHLEHAPDVTLRQAEEASPMEAKPTEPRETELPQTASAPNSPERDGHAEEPAAAGPGLSKKALLERYLDVPKGAKNITDTMYLPPELYDVFVAVWHTRKRDNRGIKKSHLIIEALLSHPEIAQELRQRKILK